MYTDEWKLEVDEDEMAALEDAVNAVNAVSQGGQSTR